MVEPQYVQPSCSGELGKGFCLYCHPFTSSTNLYRSCSSSNTDIVYKLMIFGKFAFLNLKSEFSPISFSNLINVLIIYFLVSYPPSESTFPFFKTVHNYFSWGHSLLILQANLNATSSVLQ